MLLKFRRLTKNLELYFYQPLNLFEVFLLLICFERTKDNQKQKVKLTNHKLKTLKFEI